MRVQFFDLFPTQGPYTVEHFVEPSTSVFRQESDTVYVGCECHDKLAVKSVHRAAMARYHGVEVLDIIGTFDSAREKTAEWSDNTREDAEHEAVELRGHAMQADRAEEEAAVLFREDGIMPACEFGKVEVLTLRELEFAEGAYESASSANEERKEPSNEQRGDAAAEVAFPRLFGTQAQKLPIFEYFPSKGLSACVREYIIRENEHHREQKPHHAAKHVIDGHLELQHDEREREEGEAENTDLVSVEVLAHQQNGCAEGKHIHDECDDRVVLSCGVYEQLACAIETSACHEFQC